MRIIISPAKKMIQDNDSLDYLQYPHFIEDASYLATQVNRLSCKELKEVWKCSDELAQLNYSRFQNIKLYEGLTPAILAYQGLQYQYMAPAVFEIDSFDYIERHLRILSGFYGVLKPFDGVVPYRLEMQAKLKIGNKKSLYEFWHNKIAAKLFSETDCIINLASKEYSKCISAYLNEDQNMKFITCVFGERVGNKVVEKGTYAKMARGEMVRYMAEHNITEPEQIKKFDRLHFAFAEQLSCDNNYVFLRKEDEKC